MWTIANVLTILYYGVIYDVIKVFIGILFRSSFNYFTKSKDNNSNNKPNNNFNISDIANIISAVGVNFKKKENKQTLEKRRIITDSLKDL